jgi:transcriptional regulator with XRE-family HTH domain
VSNDRLRQAISSAGLTPDELAQALQVDVKTVERWVAGRVPYARHRVRMARALGVTEADLWPDHPPSDTPPNRVELVSAFPIGADATPAWPDLLQEARERIWLLDFTLIDIFTTPGTVDLLAAKARDGVAVRLLISYATRARLASDYPIDEPYPDPEPQAAYDIALARGYIETLLAVSGVQARKFAAMRFNSLICADDQILATLHLWATPTEDAPTLHLRRGDQPGLFAQFEHHYQSIWDHASHPIESEPELFPPPDQNPAHYDRLLFDDAPPRGST